MPSRYDFKIKLIKYLYIALFLFICIYLLYFNFFLSRGIASNSYNRRLRENEGNVIRGSFLDRNSEVLVKSVQYNKTVKRKYLYSRYFSHTIGYSSTTLGSSGLEAYYNKELMSSSDTLETLKSKIYGDLVHGSNIKLTLDRTLQIYADDLLRGKNGSIVVLKPDTGEILAMVSKPDFNPGDIQENWNNLIEDPTSPLLNRASEGLYPPGSIFKVITVTAAKASSNTEEIIDCTGKVNIDGYEIKDSGDSKHGVIGLSDAFKLSCNSYFVQLGVKIRIEDLYNSANQFRFNKSIPAEFKVAQSVFPRKADDKSVAQQSIGQGEVLITPLHAALIAAAVANDGVMMEPYLVDSLIDSNNKTTKSFKPKAIATVVDANTASLLTDMMINVVKNGTGTKAKISNIQVAGKTGTAQNESGKDHAWFIGFAPADNPRIAIAVLVENGGSGGSTAAPIAGKILKKALTIIK